jgi:GMP synthase-like glutamine amidotransferase
VKSLTVLQHTSAEYLGLMEDHFEGRRIRFRYVRPFTEGVKVPIPEAVGDGLILLGGGPWGSAGGRDLPTLAEEVLLTKACLYMDKPIIAFGLGAQILSLAADGKVEAAPLEFSVGHARRIENDALNGYLPERFPHVVYMRDRPVPPSYARVLALDEAERPALFQIGERAFGFTGHPGFKLAMAEDLIMEFEEGPEEPAATLAALRAMKTEIEDALVPIMTGLVQATELMRKTG